MTGPRSAGGSVTQALVDLVLDPEEHGYREAAQRNGGQPRRHRYDRVAVAVGCAVIGFVLAAGWVHVHRGAPQAAEAHARLVTRVRAADAHVTALSRRAARLGTRLNAARAQALPPNAALVQQVNRERLAAGETAAQGPGLVVRLSEPATPAAAPSAPGGASREPEAGDHILTDRDLRSVVNELWSDGAEAIAVNGIRLTPTSAVRFAGDAVLVDFWPIASPYEVVALGDPNGLDTGFAASDVASRYQTLSGARGIGFSFAPSDDLTLPAEPAAALLYARPGSGTGSR